MKILALALVLFAPSAFAYFGGVRATRHELPEVVFYRIAKTPAKKAWRTVGAEFTRVDNDAPLCTATQIRRRVFLTAAHCAHSQVDIDLAQVDGPGKILVRRVKIAHWVVHPSIKENSFANLEAFRASDVALFVIDEDLREIGVAPISAATVTENQEVLMTGIGQSPFLDSRGVIVKDGADSYLPGEMRLDSRVIGKIEDGVMFSLHAKLVHYRTFIRTKWYKTPSDLAMSGGLAERNTFFPFDRAERKIWDEEQFRLRFVNKHVFNQMIVGDSGGPVFRVISPGVREVVGVNSMILDPQGLRQVAPQRIPANFHLAAPVIEFIARVDGGSAAAQWITETLKTLP